MHTEPGSWRNAREAIFYVPVPMALLHTHFGIALPYTC